jgi:hypothetical protein
LPDHGTVPATAKRLPGPHPSAGQQDVGLKFVDNQLNNPDPDHLSGTLIVWTRFMKER